jgi:hypothetical protein
MPELAIVTTTLFRDNLTKQFFTNLRNLLGRGNYKLYIADLGVYSIEAEHNYHWLLEVQGHHYEWLPFNAGLGYSYNTLLAQVKEPFIYFLNNDAILALKCHPKPLQAVLLHDLSIGAVGGQTIGKPTNRHNLSLSHKPETRLLVTPVPLSAKRKLPIESCRNLDYYLCDYVEGPVLFRREVFEDINFDPLFKNGNLLDFFLRLKATEKWNVAQVPTVQIKNLINKKRGVYKMFNLPDDKLFMDKWGLKKKDFIIVGE